MTVPAGQLAAAATASKAACGVDSRFSFDKLCLTPGESSVHLAATDGRRLMSYTAEAEIFSGTAERYLIDASDLLEVERLGHDPIEVAFTDRVAFLRNGRAVVSVLASVGRFPPIEKVFEHDPTGTLRVNSAKLRQAIAQALAVLDDVHNTIELVARDQQLAVRAAAPMGAVDVPIEAEGECECKLEINPETFAQVLRAAGGEEVDLGFIAPDKQLRIAGVGAPSFFIHMPIMPVEEAS